MSAHELTTGPASGYLRPLAELRLADADLAGRKAATLGELLAAGFKVPDGFVLTAAVLERAMAAAGLAADATASQVAAIALPDEVAAAVRQLAAAAGQRQLAVRSSGVAEDLPGLSYAGQYESVLGVTGARELTAAIRACWASAFSERVGTYQQTRGGAPAPRMAVLVQDMVGATSAGVAFSANPVTGDRDEAVVSAVRGLGDRLVAGRASPDEWLVRDGHAQRRTGTEDALTPAQARAVADLAHRAERHFRAPQDIEWALAGDELWLLQSRPITALPEPAVSEVPVPVVIPDGCWRRDTFISRRPWSPLQHSVFLPILNRTNRGFSAFGLAEGIEYRDVGGWMYTRIVPLRGPAEVSERIGSIVAAVSAGEPGASLRAWQEADAPRIAARSGQLQAVDLAALTDAGLETHLREAVAFAEDCLATLFRVGGASAFALGQLGVACRDLLHWSVPQTLRLVTGLPSKATEPAAKLAALARSAAGRPALRRLLHDQGAGLADRVTAADPEFAARFAGYQRAYGHRSLAFDVIDPTLAEQPELILRLIADQLARGYDPDAEAAALSAERAAAEADAGAALAGLPAAQRAEFDGLVARGRHACQVRDDKAFYAAVAWALVRYGACELGGRLVARGCAREPGDVFFLEFDEALAALRTGAACEDLIRRRRGERAWALAHPGPAWYGEPPGQQAAGADGGEPAWMTALPAQARAALAAMTWVFQVGGGAGGQQGARAGERRLAGVAASPGRYTGPVRIVLDEGQFGKLLPGDVLVCPETTPQWSVLFPSVGALVTDSGGLLSHPAIIAREYRVPAVVATQIATTFLRDGQVVTVDGGSGTVEVSP